jgi:hypothetical protein
VSPALRAALRAGLFTFIAFDGGFAVGWFGHSAQAKVEDGKSCRDEVISVDNAHGPASCTHEGSSSELKDGYLICKCMKK